MRRATIPMPDHAALENWGLSRERAHSEDRNLRRAWTDSGYVIEAFDGEVGHVAEYVIDCDSWTIRATW
ncbi:MAG: hypothetical protein IPN71_08810 [Fibrobacteres bacterium]|nr:hypothetical protein [Fibrobacterota bacterium]